MWSASNSPTLPDTGGSVTLGVHSRTGAQPRSSQSRSGSSQVALEPYTLDRRLRHLVVQLHAKALDLPALVDHHLAQVRDELLQRPDADFEVVHQPVPALCRARYAAV